MANPPPQARDQGTVNAAESGITPTQAEDLERNAFLSVLCFPPTGLAAVWQARNANCAVRTGNASDASYYNKSALRLMTFSVFLALCNPIILAVLRQQFKSG
ncbi:hypothetical protein Bpfe_017087 [Biomphalaria pfeifferi]|uniref:Uncharacterized protein n=1 Tax=Biomphalaria pfeifferi TaxID=112525 RepID=A0AAD8F802_BIOPF|nr:hypothetical protein Bpfe_017087 [Biomphalaria pfeifferi]